MLCVHCSTPLSRDDWFCPYCKRSPVRRKPRRGAAPARGRAGLTAVWLLAGALLGGYAASQGWVGHTARPTTPPRPTEGIAVPVSLTGTAEASWSAPSGR